MVLFLNDKSDNGVLSIRKNPENFISKNEILYSTKYIKLYACEIPLMALDMHK